MRTRGMIAGLLMMAGVGSAQQTPPPAFGYFRCFCQPGSPLQAPTPSLFGAPSISGWRGNVYALADVDARRKAKSACAAENRGSTLICDTCFCQQ